MPPQDGIAGCCFRRWRPSGIWIAISFSAPLFAALVSIIWLKERAGYVRGCALVVGFCGVLIVTNPGANSLTLGALFALINAVMYGTVTVAVRGMTRTESANTLVIWQCLGLANHGWKPSINSSRVCAKALVGNKRVFKDRMIAAT